LRELWGEFSAKYLLLSIVGSEIIDLDHVLYMFFYGRHEWYALEAKKFLRQGQFSNFTKFLSIQHKNNTSLASHNLYVITLFLVLAGVSFLFDWKARTVIFGAIVLHLLYDIYDDFWVLGYMNENWKHLKRRKVRTSPHSD
jgi:hypothetical protein